MMSKYKKILLKLYVVLLKLFVITISMYLILNIVLKYIPPETGCFSGM